MKLYLLVMYFRYQKFIMSSIAIWSIAAADETECHTGKRGRYKIKHLDVLISSGGVIFKLMKPVLLYNVH